MLTRFVTSSGSSRRRAQPIEAARVTVAVLAGEVGERLAVAVGALADHAVRDEVGDHRGAAPLLALVDVRQVHLDDRHVEDLERVVDRVAVVRPGAGVDDQAVGVAVGVVDPARCTRPRCSSAGSGRRASSSLRPLVDLRLELVQARARRRRPGRGAPSMSRLTPFRTRICIAAESTRSAARARAAPRRPAAPRRTGPPSPSRTRLIASPRALLVAQQRLPGPLAVDLHRLRRELALDLRRVAAGQPQRGEQPERDRLAVRQVEVGRGLERVRERVAEVEPAPRAVVVRVLQADAGLVGGRAAHVEVARRRAGASSRARPSPAAARARAASRAASRRGRRAPASGTRRRGSSPPGCRSPSCRRSPRRPGRRASSAPRPTARRGGTSRRRSRPTSVVQPPPSATTRAAAGRAGARSRAAATTPIDFASSPAGSSCVVVEPVAERLLRPRRRRSPSPCCRRRARPGRRPGRARRAGRAPPRS